MKCIPIDKLQCCEGRQPSLVFECFLLDLRHRPLSDEELSWCQENCLQLKDKSKVSHNHVFQGGFAFFGSFGNENENSMGKVAEFM